MNIGRRKMPKCNNECQEQEQEQDNSICGAISNVYHVICTRTPKHKGDHIACGSGNVHELEIWNNSNDIELSCSATTAITPPCLHANGWYRTVPGRLWGRRRVFVCTDCGDILKPEKKQESV